MKIIDEKGKLFGKINVIDFLVILFLFCALPAFYLGYKIFNKRAVVETTPEEFIEIETDCLFIKLRPDLLNIVSVGAKELNGNGQVIGEIIDVKGSEAYKYELDIGGGQKLIKEDEILKQVRVKIRLKAEVKSDNLFYKGKNIKIGFPFEFNINNRYSLNGIFAKEQEKPTRGEETVKVTLTVKFASLKPEIVKVIKNGDKQIELVRENVKRIVAKIVDVSSNRPAEVISLMEDKQDWAIVGHPKYRDLVLEIETLCVQTPQGLFLEKRPVKIGQAFEFSTDLYVISGEIINIESD